MPALIKNTSFKTLNPSQKSVKPMGMFTQYSSKGHSETSPRMFKESDTNPSDSGLRLSTINYVRDTPDHFRFETEISRPKHEEDKIGNFLTYN